MAVGMIGADDFRRFIASRLGCEPPLRLEPGRFVRFPTNGKLGDSAGWAKLFPDCEGGIVGDFRSGETWTWQAKRARPFTEEEMRAWRERIERERREAQRQREREENEAAAKARAIWTGAKEAPADHPYLRAKKVPPLGLKLYQGPALVINGLDVRGAVIMPLRNVANEIRSLEFIAADGQKRFLPGASYRGSYFALGKPGDVMAICEGAATALSIHTIARVPVRAAGSTGNLLAVAQAMRAKAPDAKVIVCADNDCETDGNPGVAKATEAARAVGGLLAVPDFGPDRPEGATDFNDLARLRGPEAVLSYIKVAMEALSPAPEAARGDASAPARGAPQPDAKNAPAGAVAAKEWPEPLDESAFYGLAGEIARAIEPNTEADPAALLLQVLVAFGVLVGRGPHVRVEGDEHHLNLFALLVGETSKARKGTSWGRVREIFSRVADWPNVVSGLSSGEGLKYAVRDPTERVERDKATGNAQRVQVDPGIADKRRLVVEAEFAQVLRQGARAGNTLSATIRSAWDTGRLATLTKNDPVTATGAHISIIGHITADELRAELTATDSANGFANRFLFMCVRRSKVLPFGGGSIVVDVVSGFASRIARAVAGARKLKAVPMTEAARQAWVAVYPTLSAGHPGLFGAVTARAEAQCLRLALVYALMDEVTPDEVTQIDRPHLLAALALWERAEASARHIFGDALGDPVADEILRALRGAGSAGLTRTAIRDLFRRHQSTERIGAALELLARRSLAECETRPSDGGRPAEVWLCM